MTVSQAEWVRMKRLLEKIQLNITKIGLVEDALTYVNKRIKKNERKRKRKKLHRQNATLSKTPTPKKNNESSGASAVIGLKSQPKLPRNR